MRSSGESYIHHPLAVCRIVAEFGLDDISSAALLHDAVEDTELSLDDLRRDFGEDVAAIVDGVTKLDRLQFDWSTAGGDDAQDARRDGKRSSVLLRSPIDCTICERSRRCLQIVSIELRRKLSIFMRRSPRLGIQEVRQQLEDLAFSALHPKRFAELDHLVSERTPERDMSVAQAIATVRTRLIEAIVQCEVTGRSNTCGVSTRRWW